MKGWLAASIALAVLAQSWIASARPACDPGIAAWLERCSSRFELVTCHRGVVVVRAPDARLDVELRARSERSFRSAGALGLSPVGQFPDWSRESEARRAALDTLVTCAERDPSLPLERTAAGAAPTPLRPIRPPWLVLAAIAALALAFGDRLRPTREAMLAVGLGVVTGVARWLLLGGSYFHQNGQGPAWIAHALAEDPGLAGYGPGFPELFAAAARLSGADPERGVWLVQSLLATCVPPAAWLVARRLGAGAWVAAALALGCALDPLLGRLAATESYFASALSLGMLASAACALAAPRPRSPRFWLPLCAAGLLLAQSLRVHPGAWPAALAVPLPLLFGPGSWRRRVRLAALGLGLIAVVVTLTSAPALAEVLRGPLGQKWLPGTRLRWDRLGSAVLSCSIAAALALALARRSWRGAALALTGALTFAVLRLTDLLSDPNPAVAAAHPRTFLPAAVCLFAVVGRARTLRQSLAFLLVAGSLLALPARIAFARLPTDVREALFVRELRGRLEPGARVAYLERAGAQLARLPLYSSPERAPLGDADSSFDLRSLPAPAYYFRSSLCATPQGDPVCAALERDVDLEPVAERALPALPSMRWTAYAGDEVRVGLFRIRR